jgi:hypothetical protein
MIYNFVNFVATKNGMMTNFFSLFSFVAVFGSGIRDPGSGINIPDPQHWFHFPAGFGPGMFIPDRGSNNSNKRGEGKN